MKGGRQKSIPAGEAGWNMAWGDDGRKGRGRGGGEPELETRNRGLMKISARAPTQPVREREGPPPCSFVLSLFPFLPSLAPPLQRSNSAPPLAQFYSIKISLMSGHHTCARAEGAASLMVKSGRPITKLCPSYLSRGPPLPSPVLLPHIIDLN